MSGSLRSTGGVISCGKFYVCHGGLHGRDNFEVGKIMAVTLLRGEFVRGRCAEPGSCQKSRAGQGRNVRQKRRRGKSGKRPDLSGRRTKSSGCSIRREWSSARCTETATRPERRACFNCDLRTAGKFPPHWHPVDENVTVLSGDFMAGMGDSYDESKMMSLAAGSYVFMPRRMHHFAGSQRRGGGAGSRSWPVQNKLCESGG